MAGGLGQFSIALYAVPGIPLFHGGEDIGRTIVEQCRADRFDIADRDVVVVAQKLVSKAERRVFKLQEFVPSAAARELAARTGHDPRACEAYLQESEEILEFGRPTRLGLMIMTRHRIGFVAQSAGVDRSNVNGSEEPHLALLPTDPDASARRIRATIREMTGSDVAVIISDSCGSLDRLGSVGAAIGFSGISAVEKLQQHDLFGRPMTPVIALVDEISAAASMLMGQAGARRPVVILRGVQYTPDDRSGIRDLIHDRRRERAPEEAAAHAARGSVDPTIGGRQS